MIVNFAYYGLIFVFSLFFQVQQQLSPQLTGLAFLPMTIVLMAVNVLAGRLITRLGARVLMVLGLALAAVGYGLLMPVSVEGSYWLLVVPMLMAASGIALMVPTMTNATLSSVDASRAGIASGVLNSARQVGGMLGVAVFGYLLRDTEPQAFMRGMHLSIGIAVALLLAASALCWFRLGTGGPWLDAPPPPPFASSAGPRSPGRAGRVGDQAVRHSRDGASRAAGIHAGCLGFKARRHGHIAAMDTAATLCRDCFMWAWGACRQYVMAAWIQDAATAWRPAPPRSVGVCPRLGRNQARGRMHQVNRLAVLHGMFGQHGHQLAAAQFGAGQPVGHHGDARAGNGGLHKAVRIVGDQRAADANGRDLVVLAQMPKRMRGQAGETQAGMASQIGRLGRPAARLQIGRRGAQHAPRGREPARHQPAVGQCAVRIATSKDSATRST